MDDDAVRMRIDPTGTAGLKGIGKHEPRAKPACWRNRILRTGCIKAQGDGHRPGVAKKARFQRTGGRQRKSPEFPPQLFGSVQEACLPLPGEAMCGGEPEGSTVRVKLHARMKLHADNPQLLRAYKCALVCRDVGRAVALSECPRAGPVSTRGEWSGLRWGRHVAFHEGR